MTRLNVVLPDYTKQDIKAMAKKFDVKASELMLYGYYLVLCERFKTSESTVKNEINKFRKEVLINWK